MDAGLCSYPFFSSSTVAKRALRASASTRVRSGRLEPCVCRSGDADNGGREVAGRGMAMEDRGGTVVGLSFGTSPLPDFEDEFFARMMALEASPLSSSRASSTSAGSFFEGSSLSAGCEPPRPSPGQSVEAARPGRGAALAVIATGGVAIPPSIKKLRRRKSEGALARSGCAIRRAFSSMVYMIKAVQSHALQIRQALFCDQWDAQQVLHVVDRELHSSFVWLFQRVFACTPALMVSVMILLANFTAFSMGENLAVATVTDPPIALARSTPHVPLTSLPSPPPTIPGFGHGAGGKHIFPLATTTPEDSDGDLQLPNHRRYGILESLATPIIRSPLPDLEDGVAMTAWAVGALRNEVQLEPETRQRLVAPVAAHLEPDEYACFDRTDLEYQLALASDPTSPVLLANYAQFLFTVRRDHDRAELYFHRAVVADPQEPTILGRFASFLWLGRGNRAAAERAYKAAMAAAPESSYPAGSYAHFLWHAGDEAHPP